MSAKLSIKPKVVKKAKKTVYKYAKSFGVKIIKDPFFLEPITLCTGNVADLQHFIKQRCNNRLEYFNKILAKENFFDQPCAFYIYDKGSNKKDIYFLVPIDDDANNDFDTLCLIAPSLQVVTTLEAKFELDVLVDKKGLSGANYTKLIGKYQASLVNTIINTLYFLHN